MKKVKRGNAGDKNRHKFYISKRNKGELKEQCLRD